MFCIDRFGLKGYRWDHIVALRELFTSVPPMEILAAQVIAEHAENPDIVQRDINRDIAEV